MTWLGPNQARVGLAYSGQPNLRSFKIELFAFHLRLWVMLRSPTGHTSHLGGSSFVTMVTKLSSNLNSRTEKCSPVRSLAQLQQRSSERDQCSLKRYFTIWFRQQIHLLSREQRGADVLSNPFLYLNIYPWGDHLISRPLPSLGSPCTVYTPVLIRNTGEFLCLGCSAATL